MSEAQDKTRALLAASTPGPWRTGHCNEGVWRGKVWCNTGEPHPFDERVLLNMNCHGDAFPVDADAALIAAAPELLAALCAELDAETKRADEAEAACAAMRAVLPGYESREAAEYHTLPAVSWGALEASTPRCIGTHVHVYDAQQGTAGAAFLTRLHTAEAERDALRARKAKVCEMCRTVPGEWTIARHACPDCGGSGAVIVEAP